MKVTLLGTGSPEPHARRASSGYLVETGADTLLLDCGGGVFDRLIQSGRKPSDIGKLFFTHLHSDHMMDYARLVHANWDGRGKDYDVWGPPPIASITEKLFGRDGVFATDLTARTENEGSKAVWVARGGTLPRPWPAPKVTEVMPGFAAQGPDWKLTSCEVPHAQPWLECMAFRIETSSGAFVYSGDAGPCDALEELSQGADLLVHWCYRLSHETASAYIAARSPAPAEIAAMAQRAGVKQLVVSHFRPHMDAPGVHEKVLMEMQANFSGQAVIAEDLMHFTIDART
ncbi:MAG: MBL fold metallo-hydrolase [Beijerinckiaceae bacterium]